MNTVSEQEALRRCAAYCSLVERCGQDVVRKMDRWEVPFPAQQRILARLREEGFLDEARYCRAYVNDKTRIAKWGRNKILYALRQKQISADDIQSAFRDIETADVAEQLAEILRQKRKTVKGRDEYEIRAKLIRFALGRGFDMDDILKQI